MMVLNTKRSATYRWSAGTFLYPVLAVVLYFLTTFIAFFIVSIPKLKEFARAQMAPDALEGLLDAQDLLHAGLLYSVLQILLFSLLLFALRKRGKPYIFKRIPQKQAWILTPVLLIGTLGLSSLWIKLVELLSLHSTLWKSFSDVYEDLSSQFLSGLGWQDFLLLVVLVPLAEELLFRGVVLSELKLALNPYLAVFFTALLFGLFHGNVVQGVYAFIGGVVLGLLYIWTESLPMSILAHMFFNFIGGYLPNLLTRSTSAPLIQLIYDLVCYAFFLLCIPTLYWFWPYRRAGKTELPERKELHYVVMCDSAEPCAEGGSVEQPSEN